MTREASAGVARHSQPTIPLLLVQTTLPGQVERTFVSKAAMVLRSVSFLRPGGEFLNCLITYSITEWPLSFSREPLHCLTLP